MPDVLMIGPSTDARGGMAAVEAGILKAIDPRRVTVRFVPTYAGGSAVKKAIVALKAYRALDSLLDSADVFHVHMASRGSFMRKRVFMERAFKAGVGVVAHLHGSEFAVWYDEECDKSRQALIRETLQKCSKVVVLSEEWRDFFVDRAICPRERLAVLYNAVDVPLENVTDYTNNTVLFMGRLGERKNPEALIRAAATVVHEHPGACFVFAGDGEVNRYRSLARALGVSKSCVFTGWLSDDEKRDALRQASVFCLPSRNEGMPMSLLEAMSYGLACIAAPVGGIPQVIQNGMSGYLVTAGDTRALGKLIGGLLSDPAGKRRLGEAARTVVRDRFGLEAYAARLTDIYEEVARK